MEITVTTHSPTQTKTIAKALGNAINKPTVIAFLGGLGAGKTCFTAGLGLGLDYTDDVTSPTFALVNEYYGGRYPIFHFDLYRIDGVDELDTIGFFEYLDQEAILVLEWSERILPELPQDTVFIQIEIVNDTTRRLTVTCNNELDCLKELEQYVNTGL